MPYAIVDSAGAILGVYPKPSPFMTIPAGGRMLPCNPPEPDADVEDLILVQPVPEDAMEVGYTLTPKDPAVVNAVWMRRKSAVIQKHLDDSARERNYDGILSAASYAGSQHPRFGPEGLAYSNWRDACWEYGYQVLAEVGQGIRTMPSDAELVAELPALVLPA